MLMLMLILILMVMLMVLVIVMVINHVGVDDFMARELGDEVTR